MNDIHDASGLHRVDMNLLVAFDTLVRERSVTRAARLAGVSQSAMSHTLRRLRALFDDPLLVRGSAGMVLTPRAESLVVPLRSGLLGLSRALAEPSVFEPSTARRVFRLTSPDLFDVLALPPLLRRLGEEAPGIELAVVPSPRSLSSELETGELDLAIAPVLLDPEPFDLGTADLGTGAAPDLRRRTLFSDSFRCFMSRSHPSLGTKRRLSLSAFTSVAHVLVSPTGAGAGLVDRELARRDLGRRVAVRVPQFSTALAILGESDLLLTAPAALGRVAGAEIRSLAPPFQIPRHGITMVWHPRFSEDPGHLWLRELLVDVTRAFG